MKIPYGRSNFRQIRSEGFFYADKTPFLPKLESGELGYAHLVLLRPRRFGKSTLLSMMEHYYDRRWEADFDALFGGLWIHDHPTPERHSYLVLSFDFSQVATDRGTDALFRTFFEAVRSGVEALLLAHRARIPVLSRLDERLSTFQDPEALMASLMRLVAQSGERLYVLVDEYDHFANRLLSAGSIDTYESILETTGFVRSFFATLKAGTASGAVARMLVTGVSPLVLDDLSSGFNIASNISLTPELNAIAGFTRNEVARAVDELTAAHPALAELPEIGDREALLCALEDHYDGYRFSERALERVFNSDMVLYFLAELAREQRCPADMLDPNVRTDYRHLQRIGPLTGAVAAERRALLQRILSDGTIRANLVRQFGVHSLSSHAPYLSLLYYLGLLTLRETPRGAEGHSLEIPNRVIRELSWEHLALMLAEQADVAVHVEDLHPALQSMAVDGDIQPFLALFTNRVMKKLAVKDAIRFDEKAIKLMLMTYLSLSRTFHVLTEKELAQGYCDLFLGPTIHAPGARYSWLLELKYVPTGATPARIEAAFTEAEEQVARYASDEELLPLLLRDRELKAGTLLFVGPKRALFRPWSPRNPRDERSAPRGAKPRSPRPARRTAKAPRRG